MNLKARICLLMHDSMSMIMYRVVGAGRNVREPYRVCMDCGTAWAYDTDKMRVTYPIAEDRAGGETFGKVGEV